jgi:hypothetical protein
MAAIEIIDIPFQLANVRVGMSRAVEFRVPLPDAVEIIDRDWRADNF